MCDRNGQWHMFPPRTVVFGRPVASNETDPIIRARPVKTASDPLEGHSFMTYVGEVSAGVNPPRHSPNNGSSD